MKKPITSGIILSVLLTGCATHPDNLVSTTSSALKYEDYSCKKIAIESDDINRRALNLYNILAKKADNDKWQAGVGLILLWPMLFTLEGGDGAEAVEYRMLKGDYEALRKLSLEKECGHNIPDLDSVLEKHAKEKQKEEAKKEKVPDYPGKKK